MKKYTNRIKLMPKFTKCMSLAMILTFTGYEEAFAEMSYAEQTSFTVSMENQTLKSVINWVEKNTTELSDKFHSFQSFSIPNDRNIQYHKARWATPSRILVI